MTIATDARSFRIRKDKEQRGAAQLAALFLTCGIDLQDAMVTVGERRAQIVLRVERLLERERLRGQRRHWCYDLNRHIALKQALDRLRDEAIRTPQA